MRNLLLAQPAEFIPFLCTAHYSDGGQNAALECLGTSLGEVMATFLGDGNWRPYRKAIRECWEKNVPSQNKITLLCIDESNNCR